MSSTCNTVVNYVPLSSVIVNTHASLGLAVNPKSFNILYICRCTIIQQIQYIHTMLYQDKQVFYSDHQDIQCIQEKPNTYIMTIQRQGAYKHQNPC